MDFIYAICPPGVLCQIFVGLSRTVILFIVSSGLSLILGVLRIPNVFHGSLYMIGAFMAFTITSLVGGDTGFWLALIGAPIGVGLLSLATERGLFQYLYEREHLMLILFTFAISLVFGGPRQARLGSGVQVRTRTPPLPGLRPPLRGPSLSPLQCLPPRHGTHRRPGLMAPRQQDQGGQDLPGRGGGP